jgi:hypothetical protein
MPKFGPFRFDKYRHRGVWTESLHSFLFVQLILNRTDINNLDLEHYHQFELKDIHVAQYNEWIDRGCPFVERMVGWIEKNIHETAQFRLYFGEMYKPRVILWSDRRKSDYYKEKLQAAFEFENYIEHFFRKKYKLELGPFVTPEGQYKLGENKLGIEIKNDTLISKYGNLYIEYAEKSGSNLQKYVRSGILKDDRSVYFLTGDRERFWVFKKQRLKEIYHQEKALRQERKPSQRGIVFKIKPTSLGFVIPLKEAIKEAIDLDMLVAELRKNNKDSANS